MSDDVRIDNDDRSTATLRIPDVRCTDAGSILVELVPADAAVLARILIHYGTSLQLRELTGVAEGYDADVWNQVAHRLLTEKAAAALRTEAVLVPFHADHRIPVPREYLGELGPDEGTRP